MEQNKVRRFNYYFIPCKYFNAIHYEENGITKGKPFCKRLNAILTEINKDCYFCEIVEKIRKRS